LPNNCIINLTDRYAWELWELNDGSTTGRNVTNWPSCSRIQIGFSSSSEQHQTTEAYFPGSHIDVPQFLVCFRSEFLHEVSAKRKGVWTVIPSRLCSELVWTCVLFQFVRKVLYNKAVEGWQHQ
jgi:hypothetical protein